MGCRFSQAPGPGKKLSGRLKSILLPKEKNLFFSFTSVSICFTSQSPTWCVLQPCLSQRYSVLAGTWYSLTAPAVDHALPVALPSSALPTALACLRVCLGCPASSICLLNSSSNRSGFSNSLNVFLGLDTSSRQQMLPSVNLVALSMLALLDAQLQLQGEFYQRDCDRGLVSFIFIASVQQVRLQ